MQNGIKQGDAERGSEPCGGGAEAERRTWRSESEARLGIRSSLSRREEAAVEEEEEEIGGEDGSDAPLFLV
jgi:hypothetical protein